MPCFAASLLSVAILLVRPTVHTFIHSLYMGRVEVSCVHLYTLLRKYSKKQNKNDIVWWWLCLVMDRTMFSPTASSALFIPKPNPSTVVFYVFLIIVIFIRVWNERTYINKIVYDIHNHSPAGKSDVCCQLRYTKSIKYLYGKTSDKPFILYNMRSTWTLKSTSRRL